jgi:membrane protein implicated in regulation of membrane protease activity
MTLIWWYWIVFGLLLVVAELAAAGGFYIIFFGIGAIVVGLLSLFGLAGPEWMQLLLFSALSLSALALFRGRLLHWFQSDPQRPLIDTLVGEIGTASEDLQPSAVGKVELRGTTWSARNDSGIPITFGTRIRVARVEGLLLHVKPEGVH